VTYLEAALTVLRTSGRAMTTREIVDEALARGLLSPKGETPISTMSAKLYGHVRDSADPLIERHARPGKTKAIPGSVTWSLRKGGELSEERY
jgi:HB1, ASXL, restriction endonuclease HTH domain